jgi:hypothetical protein
MKPWRTVLTDCGNNAHLSVEVAWASTPSRCYSCGVSDNEEEPCADQVPARPYRAKDMSSVWFVLILAAAAVVGCCLWAPWVQVDPALPASSAFLGFAPIWTRAFALFPGARVDGRAMGANIGVLLFCAVLIGLVRAMRRSTKRPSHLDPQG